MNYILIEVEYDRGEIGITHKQFTNARDCYNYYLERKQIWSEYFSNSEDVCVYFNSEVGFELSIEEDDVEYMCEWWVDNNDGDTYMIKIEIDELN